MKIFSFKFFILTASVLFLIVVLVFVFFEFFKKPIKLMDENTLCSVSLADLQKRQDFIYSLIFEEKRIFIETLFFFLPWSNCAYNISLGKALTQISREASRRRYVDQVIPVKEQTKDFTSILKENNLI